LATIIATAAHADDSVIATGRSWTRTSDYARKSRRSDKSSPSRSATFEPTTFAAATALHERLACTR
jgi:hypothetical protein